ncbi:swr1 complex component [Paramarasmius palmivorus]|uniref:DNA helicase n=1 Tax=Paramarasmius palmivorus TaxID=297713 RepID=A0AAW0CDA9_9AGAR
MAISEQREQRRRSAYRLERIPLFGKHKQTTHFPEMPNSISALASEQARVVQILLSVLLDLAFHHTTYRTSKKLAKPPEICRDPVTSWSRVPKAAGGLYRLSLPIGRLLSGMVSEESISTAGISGGNGRGQRRSRDKHRTAEGDKRDEIEYNSQGLDAEVSETGKTELLEQKQVELESIYDRHDSLIRELFHMENFVTMTTYDPMEAKRDDSMVFRQWKSQAQLDLLDKAESSTTGNSRRRTRRAQVERTNLLRAPTLSAPVLQPVKSKGKKSTAAATADIWNIIASARANGKGKEKAVEEELCPPSVLDTDSVSVQLNHDRPRRKQTTESISATPDPTGTPKPKRRPETAIDLNVPQPHHQKRRKIEATPDVAHSIHDPGGSSTPDSQVGSATAPVKSRMLPQRSAAQRNSHISTTSQRAPSSPPPLPFLSAIKRVKLIVRKPPPMISSPLHIAPRPRHNENLEKLLSSWSYQKDEDIPMKELDHRIRSDAETLHRAAMLRKEDRYYGDIDTSALDLANLKWDPQKIIAQGRESKDIWDYCVDDAIEFDRSRRKRLTGQAIAAQVASKIRAYWDAQVVKQDKAKAQEEKRLKQLAKMTIKMVTTEWKKAVFHIREQERLKLEAEELRRGHEHLDAILNQSGQILETQQVDLTRGDMSRSLSRSVSVQSGVRDSDDEDEEEGEDEDEADEGTGKEGEEGDDEGGGDTDVNEDDMSQGDITMDIDLSAIYGDSQKDQSRIESLVDPHLGLSQGGTPIGTSRESSPQLLYPEGQADTDIEDGIQTPVPGSPAPSRDTTPVPCTVDEVFPIGDNTVNNNSRSPTSDGVVTPPIEAEDTSIIRDPKDSDGIELALEGAVFVDPKHTLLIPQDDGENTVDTRQNHGRGDDEAGDAQVTGPQTNVGVEQASPSGQEVGPPELPEDGIADLPTGVENSDDDIVPDYLRPYAVAPVKWDPGSKMTSPVLLRGALRPYQFSGLEWLASLHTNNLNGILADEMGLGKTIQTISLLAYLACERGIWGPHLIIVPTSVLLNWEMEFKKFLPAFRILSYHGTTKRRKELRQGWNDKHHFNVCITSYTLASRDAHIFKRKPWYYMILDEAHMIKNFRSQRWNTLLMFRSFRRLLLTGTPLQNNLTELWALLQFLMSGANFANLKEFGEWFSSELIVYFQEAIYDSNPLIILPDPLEKAIEMGNALDDETMQRVSKLHTVLRPYLLRRLKRDVEKELPSKFEHLVLCPLSKRQRYLYDEFMARSLTQDALQSGIYQKIANILMQLRKVCNHPDLFEVRPIVTSFSMSRSAVADFEIQELLIRRRLLKAEESIDLDFLNLRFVQEHPTPLMTAIETRRLDATPMFPFHDDPGEPPPKDTRTITGFRTYTAWQRRAENIAQWKHLAYINRLRCMRMPIYSSELLHVARQLYKPILPLSATDPRSTYMHTVRNVHAAVFSYKDRAEQVAGIVDRFAFVTPAVVARDLPRFALKGFEQELAKQPPQFDAILHRTSVKLQIAFPDSSLLQYDCGKLQKLADLLREKKAGDHRVLIFTQMTRILDILEIFLNFHGYLYLRLDGATKIEDRQYITERFNADPRIFCFISSSRSGGVGINLTGADTVVFYDSDFNPQMDRQCEDRAHRIGQIRDVHIYRFVSQHTVEEAMLRKANQKRSLDDIVIQKGEFDWRSLFDNEAALTKALGEFEDTEDARAAEVAAREAVVLEGADNDDFEVSGELDGDGTRVQKERSQSVPEPDVVNTCEGGGENQGEGEEEEGGTVVEYMLSFVRRNAELFQDWRL